MLKAFVDTSVLLRILVKDDEVKRKASENLIKNAKTKPPGENEMTVQNAWSKKKKSLWLIIASTRQR